MRVLKIEHKYRTFGLNYGVPMYHIYTGVGPTYKLEELLKELSSRGLNIKQWVCLLGLPLEEQGAGVFCEAIRACRAFSEVEARGDQPTPLWFLNVDRWSVELTRESQFNYGSLRTNRDLLYIKSDVEAEVERFLNQAEKLPCYKAVVTANPESVRELVKRFGNVRVFKKENI